MTVKPTLHLVALAGLPPEERLKALVALFEKITGRKVTPRELEELRATQTSASR